MKEGTKSASSAVNRSSRGTAARPAISERLEQFERRQSDLWRLTFLLLLVLSIVFAAVSWDTIRSLAHRFEALPIGLVLLVALFGLYAWKRTQEISELRGLVRGIEHRDTIPPSEQQLDHLFEVISRSQQGYRDLIDSFDDVLLALSLDGQIRAVNRSFADLVGAPFPQIIGRPLSEFLEEGAGEDRKSTRLNSSHGYISYAVFCLKKKNSPSSLRSSSDISPRTRQSDGALQSY